MWDRCRGEKRARAREWGAGHDPERNFRGRSDSLVPLAWYGKKVPIGGGRWACRGNSDGHYGGRKHGGHGLWRKFPWVGTLAAAQTDATHPAGIGRDPSGIAPRYER